MKSVQSSHQLLIQKLLVSIHYLTLFKDEIILVEKTPSLLGASVSTIRVQDELSDVLSAIAAMEKQEKLIRSTFWYDEASFKLMNHSLDIVGTWVEGIDHVLETCQQTSVFQVILGDDRIHVFGVLAEVYSSLKIVNLSIKEDSEEVLFFNPLRMNIQSPHLSKEELMAKIDAMLPAEEDIMIEEMPAFEVADRDEVVKLFRHYLFDNGGSRVYVIDAQEDLGKEIDFYNTFNRFTGAYDDISTSLVLLEEVLSEMEERSQNKPQESNLSSFPPIYVIIYGQNKLMLDSRFESLMSELTTLIEGTAIYILSYQAYL